VLYSAIALVCPTSTDVGLHIGTGERPCEYDAGVSEESGSAGRMRRGDNGAGVASWYLANQPREWRWMGTELSLTVPSPVHHGIRHDETCLGTS
jgi:hypothetical protein